MVAKRINILTWEKAAETIMPSNLPETERILGGIGLCISWGNRNIYFMEISKKKAKILTSG